jgi:hypothetical protein
MKWKMVIRVREKYKYGVLVVKLELRRPLGRHRRRWENNTKMHFQ